MTITGSEDAHRTFIRLCLCVCVFIAAEVQSFVCYIIKVVMLLCYINIK